MFCFGGFFGVLIGCISVLGVFGVFVVVRRLELRSGWGRKGRFFRIVLIGFVFEKVF